jgi:hypothetical protein
MRKAGVLLLGLLLVGGASALVQVATPGPRPPADLLPAGPLLVLEAKDFSALLRDWQASPEKQRWLESDNFRVFSRSRLYLRLVEAHGEFAAAAGFPPQMAMVETVAGRESALALYDIGKLEFLYVTRLPMARAMETLLWERRGEYEPRRAAGLPYYVRVDTESGRVVGFATTDDYLLLATREDLLAGALALLSSDTASTVKGEPWYDRAVRAAGPAGELRLVLNLDAVVATPHFRSYWVQRNAADLRQYVAAVSDLHRSAGEIREERVLLRSLSPEERAGVPAATTEVDLGELLRLVPDDHGFYRARVSPTVEEAIDLLKRKVLAPFPGGIAPTRKTAPRVGLSSGIVGSTAALDTRIDQEPPKIVSGTFAPQALRTLLAEAGLKAVLQVQSSRTLPDDVFVEQQSALVLLASSDWEGGSARQALLEGVEGLWTTSRLGVHWVEQRHGEYPYYELDGPARLAVATHGPLLLVANRAEGLTAVLEKLAEPPASNVAPEGVLAAQFQHGRERHHFIKMMRLLDHPWIQNYRRTDDTQGREPRFFSENLGSLSDTLERLDRAAIVVRDNGSRVSQTVVYRLRE